MFLAKPKYYVPFIVLILAFAVVFTLLDSNRNKKIHKDFTKVEVTDAIAGVIDDIYTSKGASFITLRNGNKIFLPTSSNRLYKKYYLDNNLQVGDSILKKLGSDTVFIQNLDKKKFFVIGKFINQ